MLGDSWEMFGGTGLESHFMSFCPSDSPMGPKHRDAGGQDPHWPQQVDHRPELGAPSHVSDS